MSGGKKRDGEEDAPRGFSFFLVSRGIAAVTVSAPRSQKVGVPRFGGLERERKGDLHVFYAFSKLMLSGCHDS